MQYSRRDLLRQGVGAAAGLAGRSVLPAAGLCAAGSWTPARARENQPPYGAAVNQWAVPKDAAYREALGKYCKLVVSEGSMKMDQIRPARDRYDFTGADDFVNFATTRNLGIRGHTLIWYAALPGWTREISNAAEAERELNATIEQLVSRYADRIGSWDVVNEPIEDPPKTGLRDSLWHQHLGPDYILKAFKAARAAAPKAELVINEYGIETADEGARTKRRAFLELIQRIVDGGAPVDTIGIQAHLVGDRPIDRPGLSAFLRQVQAMNLKVIVTELDVNDKMLPGPPDRIDALVANRVQEFLETVYSVQAPTAVLTWGITDRYTWMPTWHARPDKLRNRCLPLDENMQPKPFMNVIRQFCRAG
jgi:endo-1,4-beta-xylanase